MKKIRWIVGLLLVLFSAACVPAYGLELNIYMRIAEEVSDYTAPTSASVAGNHRLIVTVHDSRNEQADRNGKAYCSDMRYAVEILIDDDWKPFFSGESAPMSYSDELLLPDGRHYAYVDSENVLNGAVLLGAGLTPGSTYTFRYKVFHAEDDGNRMFGSHFHVSLQETRQGVITSAEISETLGRKDRYMIGDELEFDCSVSGVQSTAGLTVQWYLNGEKAVTGWTYRLKFAQSMAHRVSCTVSDGSSMVKSNQLEYYAWATPDPAAITIYTADKRDTYTDGESITLVCSYKGTNPSYTWSSTLGNLATTKTNTYTFRADVHGINSYTLPYFCNITDGGKTLAAMDAYTIMVVHKHQYSWTVERPATASAEGVRAGTCTACGATCKEAIPKLTVSSGSNFGGTSSKTADTASSASMSAGTSSVPAALPASSQTDSVSSAASSTVSQSAGVVSAYGTSEVSSDPVEAMPAESKPEPEKTSAPWGLWMLLPAGILVAGGAVAFVQLRRKFANGSHDKR